MEVNRHPNTLGKKVLGQLLKSALSSPKLFILGKIKIISGEADKCLLKFDTKFVGIGS